MEKSVRRRQFERHCSAAIRARSGVSSSEYRQQRLFVSERPIPLYTPFLVADGETDELAVVRGTTDGMAERLNASDQKLHRSLLPESEIARLIFDSLEQLRVESIMSSRLAGSRQNLQSAFDHWTTQCIREGVIETELGQLIFGVMQIVRSRLVANIENHMVEDFIESVRFRIAPLIGEELVGLKKHRHDQAKYAEYALNIASIVGDIAEAGQADDDAAESIVTKIRLPMPPVEEDDRYIEAGTPGQGELSDFDEFGEPYQVFTREFDREVRASDLYREAQRIELRNRLDKLIAAQAISIPRLAQRLRRLFALSTLSGWNFGEDEGFIDGRRLSQLVSNPANHRLFKKEKEAPQCDTVITFLVDNTGSMKRQRFETVTVLLDIYCRALELAGIQSEILGFSTGGWSGGKSIQKWRAAGCPESPGRVNDQLHVVYKDVDMSWRRARTEISAMLNTHHYREGLDGEAIEWACNRLRQRTESRKGLVLISDGAPMDTATSQCNGEDYLLQHMKRVIKRQSRMGGIELCSIGIDLDMEPFFDRSVNMDLSATIGHRAFRALELLFSQKGRRVSLQQL